MGEWLGQPLERDALSAGGFPASMGREGTSPQEMLETPKAFSSWSLSGSGIPWGPQLMCPLMGNLETGISSHNIPPSQVKMVLSGGALTSHPTPAPHRPLLGPPNLQVGVAGLTREPHHQDGGSGREALVRLPKPGHRPQHRHVGTRGTRGGGGRRRGR